MNYPKNDTDTICLIFRKEEDTTKYVLDCEVELEKGRHTMEMVTKTTGNRC